MSWAIVGERGPEAIIRPTAGVDVDLTAKPACEVPGCDQDAEVVFRYKCGCHYLRCADCTDEILASLRKVEKRIARRRVKSLPFLNHCGHEWLLYPPGIMPQILDVVPF